MAQKTMETIAGKTSKARKPSSVTEGITLAEITVTAPQSTKQEYPEVNAAIDRGLADVAAGRVHKRRSYAEYADLEIED